MAERNMVSDGICRQLPFCRPLPPHPPSPCSKEQKKQKAANTSYSSVCHINGLGGVRGASPPSRAVPFAVVEIKRRATGSEEHPSHKVYPRHLPPPVTQLQSAVGSGVSRVWCFPARGACSQCGYVAVRQGLRSEPPLAAAKSEDASVVSSDSQVKPVASGPIVAGANWTVGSMRRSLHSQSRTGRWGGGQRKSVRGKQEEPTPSRHAFPLDMKTADAGLWKVQSHEEMVARSSVERLEWVYRPAWLPLSRSSTVTSPGCVIR
ncbi:hypothetical protein C0Q70_15986 [Pomacea canaliculata]|uniref:Uncharacterized protein n=1 Tax=Pomacea canaliculata TaxID=400727 RepID=A0A2T7NNH7_POMCA|nr:hypothetical protein C0Q70_15986 [Pomacea canaliculata]